MSHFCYSENTTKLCLFLILAHEIYGRASHKYFVSLQTRYCLHPRHYDANNSRGSVNCYEGKLDKHYRISGTVNDVILLLRCLRLYAVLNRCLSSYIILALNKIGMRFIYHCNSMHIYLIINHVDKSRDRQTFHSVCFAPFKSDDGYNYDVHDIQVFSDDPANMHMHVVLVLMWHKLSNQCSAGIHLHFPDPDYLKATLVLWKVSKFD